MQIHRRRTGGQFPLQSAIESLKTALRVKKKLGWKEYFICTNVDITGSQEQKILEVHPEVKFYTQSFWLSCCSEFQTIVAPRFRLLVRIEEPAVLMSINKIFLQDYAKALASSLAKSPLSLFVYSNRRKEIFRVPFSPDCTVDDVLEILIKIFQLPTARTYEAEEVSVSLSYKLVIDNSSVPLDKKLSELGLVNDSVVTCWTTIVWQDDRENTRADVTRMEMMTVAGAMKGMRSPEERGEAAIHKFKKEIDGAFDASLKQLAALRKSKSIASAE